MKGTESKTEIIAVKIADLILNQTYISKEDLVPKIDAYLKAFVKSQSVPVLVPKDLKQEEILKQKRNSTMHHQLQQYYASELFKVVGVEGIKAHNKNAELIREGFYDKKTSHV